MIKIFYLNKKIINYSEILICKIFILKIFYCEIDKKFITY